MVTDYVALEPPLVAQDVGEKLLVGTGRNAVDARWRKIRRRTWIDFV